MREARNDAAPFALAAAATLVALALIARNAGWEYLGQPLWWMWLIVAAPYVFLVATLLLGFKRLVHHDRRRENVIGLLTLVWAFNVFGVVVLVASLIAHSASHITGFQLFASGGAVWFTNTIAFGLAFWEFDCGGPSRRHSRPTCVSRTSSSPRTRTPSSPATAGHPRLWDYFYLSLTNATAFSPTDAMPLTRPAKRSWQPNPCSPL